MTNTMNFDDFMQAAKAERKDFSGVDFSLTSDEWRKTFEECPNVFVEANLSKANLSEANLRGVNLSWANLAQVNLSLVNLTRANLSEANLRWANLARANLSGADLSEADLSGVNLSGANLSGAIGLLSQKDWLLKNGEPHEEGLVFYKAQNASHASPSHWHWKEGEYLTETVNPNRTDDCGCGVNWATCEWVKAEYPNSPIWRVLIERDDYMTIVVPYNTDGKARNERVKLLGLVN